MKRIPSLQGAVISIGKMNRRISTIYFHNIFANFLPFDMNLGFHIFSLSDAIWVISAREFQNGSFCFASECRRVPALCCSVIFSAVTNTAQWIKSPAFVRKGNFQVSIQECLRHSSPKMPIDDIPKELQRIPLECIKRCYRVIKVLTFIWLQRSF